MAYKALCYSNPKLDSKKKPIPQHPFLFPDKLDDLRKYISSQEQETLALGRSKFESQLSYMHLLSNPWLYYMKFTIWLYYRK